MMLERAGVVLLLAGATLLAALIVRSRARARLAAVEGQAVPVAIRSQLDAAIPGVVYFYGPHCGSCRQQATILDRLTRQTVVRVVPLDAVEQADLADQMGIATIPATVVVAPNGVIQTVNLGLRSLVALTDQVRRATAAGAVS